jgi:hypothetical protein
VSECIRCVKTRQEQKEEEQQQLRQLRQRQQEGAGGWALAKAESNLVMGLRKMSVIGGGVISPDIVRDNVAATSDLREYVFLRPPSVDQFLYQILLRRPHLLIQLQRACTHTHTRHIHRPPYF